MDIFAKLGFRPIFWSDGHLIVLDQRKLPTEESYIRLETVEQAVMAISDLIVRGAPLIGITAAYALTLLPNISDNLAFENSCAMLKSTRPTAVNLSWAVDRMAAFYRQAVNRENLADDLLAEAVRIHQEDAESCRKIGDHGNQVISDPCRILTHCNAGALATGGIGTALGVIYTAFFSGRKIEAWVDETRPVLQGARLTAWELSRAKVPFKLITDNMAAELMSRKLIDLVIVGADRIAGNLDIANKIGTYGLAVLASYHDIPFYCAAPTSTFDTACPDGRSIPIEFRAEAEITAMFGKNIAPENCPVRNPAFDITPNELITGIITENGILKPGRQGLR